MATVALPALACVLTLVLQAHGTGAARVLFGVLSVLLLPGYALTLLAFPRRSDVSTIERLAASAGLSACTVGGIAIVLDRSPAGISEPTVTAGVAIVTLTSLAIATVRWAGVSPAEQFFVPLPLSLPLLTRGSEWPRPAGAITPVLLVIFAVSGAALGLSLLQQSVRATGFGVLGPDGLAENLMRSARAGEENSLTTVVTNQEGRPAVYFVVIRDSEGVVGTGGPVAVGDGETARIVSPMTLEAPPGLRALSIELLKDGHAQPFRQLRLWIEVVR